MFDPIFLSKRLLRALEKLMLALGPKEVKFYQEQLCESAPVLSINQYVLNTKHNFLKPQLV